MMTSKQKNLIIRTITGILFVAIMITGFLSPQYMVILFAIITGMTIWEFTGLVSDEKKITVNRFISVIAGVYFFIAMSTLRIGIVDGVSIFAPYILTIIYLFISELYLKKTNPILNLAYTMLAQMYIAIPFSLITVIAFQPNELGNTFVDMLLPLSIFVFLWINDTGAYCAGSLFGKHKLFLRVSPGKTWEGSIGGVIFVIIASIVFYYLTANTSNVGTYSLNLLQWIFLGIVVSIFGTFGDLVESLFKRTLGVKDSGNILPGHGGMLDRFDSALIAIPASVVYLYALSIF